jgi:hypothetical protein
VHELSHIAFQQRFQLLLVVLLLSFDLAVLQHQVSCLVHSHSMALALIDQLD